MPELTSLIQQRLARHKRHVIENGNPRAAVLVPLYTVDQDAFVLFTRRTETVEHHKGQISFPGGAADATDPDLLNTALRETQEELGIPPEQVQILGMLDDERAAVSGFAITPFVGIIPYPYPFVVSASEISEIVLVPLHTFRDPLNLRAEEHDRGNERIKVYFYRYGPHEIWGVTARIMKGMIDLVFEDEQP